MVLYMSVCVCVYFNTFVQFVERQTVIVTSFFQ